MSATENSAANPSRTIRSKETEALCARLAMLKMPFAREHFEPLAQEAAAQHWPHVGYFARLSRARLPGARIAASVAVCAWRASP